MTINAQIKILFLAADPSDATRLRLGQELRDIRERLQISKCRDRFVLESRESVRPGDLTQAILDVEPEIVHFSGHGLNTGELCLENKVGKVQPVTSDALIALFKLVANQVRCVVLNACYSEMQAKAIAQHIPFVIGMSRSIGDSAAILFSTGFYKALGANRSIEEAYEFGCIEINIEGNLESSTPMLHRKETVTKSKVAWELNLNATLEDLDEQKLETIINLLRQISGDPSITLKKIEKGSIKLTFEGSQDGFEQIKKLIEERQLTELQSIEIQSVRQHQPRQSRDVKQHQPRQSREVKGARIFDPIPSDTTDYILCSYTNATSKIQVARITNIANWYFERVVFPGQRLVFEAMPNAQLEVHSGMLASAILTDTIPCSRLQMESEPEAYFEMSEEIERFIVPETSKSDRFSGWIFNR